MTDQLWNIDTSHSRVGFAVRHMLISKVRGAFTRWSGTLHLHEGDLSASSVEVTIDAASIDTQEPKRDEHLRSPDFFEVERFPELTFRSTGVEDLGDGRLRVTGDLSIHGVTREVVLDAELTGRGTDPWGGTRIAFEARTTINRKDFGLSWNQVLETGGVLVGEKIEIALEVQAVQAAKTAVA
jgi:polyisoprenoid-binding protein YceI